MAKDGFYFSHDFSARNDTKLQQIIRKKGMAGVGLFWCLVELLYEENGKLFFKNIEDIAFALRVKSKEIKDLVENFEVFQKSDECFWSESVLARLEQRNEKSEKAKNSVNKRWSKERTQYDRIENVKDEKYESNTIKNSIVKYNKEENSIEKETYHPQAPDLEKWNDQPSPSDVGPLPKNIVEASIVQVQVIQRATITEADVLAYWETWKIQTLTGKKHYPSPHEVFSHFINTIKNQRFSVKKTKDEKRKQELSPAAERILLRSTRGQTTSTGS